MKHPAKQNPKTLGAALATVAFVFVYATDAFSAGLPQLDPTTYSSQLIWLGLTFSVLYFLMSTVALPRISNVLEERHHHIDGRLEKAERLKEEAQAAARSYEKVLAEARDESHKAIIAARVATTRQANEKHAELTTRLGVKVKTAEDTISKARARALASIGTAVTEIARTAGARLTGLDFAEDEVTAAVAVALKIQTDKEAKS